MIRIIFEKCEIVLVFVSSISYCCWCFWL